MDWIQAFFIIGTLGIFTFWWLFTKLDSDVKEIRKDIQQQNSRIDKLYEMFIDLLKERK